MCDQTGRGGYFGVSSIFISVFSFSFVLFHVFPSSLISSFQNSISMYMMYFPPSPLAPASRAPTVSYYPLFFPGPLLHADSVVCCAVWHSVAERAVVERSHHAPVRYSAGRGVGSSATATSIADLSEPAEGTIFVPFFMNVFYPRTCSLIR